MAMPTELAKPCPSGPVVTSTPGVWCTSGWPGVRDSQLRNASMSSSVSPKPARNSIEYCRIEAWPLDSTKRSRSGHSGSFGSKRMIRLNSTCARGASAIAVPWCPDLAFSGASMAKPRMREIACCSCSGVNATRRKYPSGLTRSPGDVAASAASEPLGSPELLPGRTAVATARSPPDVAGGRQAGGNSVERHEVPGAPVDAAVGEDLAVVGELELATHQAVGELARLDGERADVAGDLFVVLAETAAEDHLEHARAGFVGRAVDQADEVRRDRDRRRRRRGHREHRAGDVDARRRPGGLAHLEVLDEQGRDDVHARQACTPAGFTGLLTASPTASAAAWALVDAAWAALEAACLAVVAACAAFVAAARRGP